MLADDRRVFRAVLAVSVLGTFLGASLSLSLIVIVIVTSTASIGDAVAVAAILAALLALPIGLAAAMGRTAWGPYLIVRWRLVRRGDLPVRLAEFLDDAHRNREVLRRVGAIYQFRHLDLQRRPAGAGSAFAPVMTLLAGWSGGLALLATPVDPSIATLLVGSVGCGIAAALDTSWSQFVLVRHWLAWRHSLPADMLGFLEDACDRGVLIQMGGVWEFRHPAVVVHLAGPPEEPDQPQSEVRSHAVRNPVRRLESRRW